MTVCPGSCGSERSITIELLFITVSHQFCARPSNCRLAIYNIWSYERAWCAQKYMDILCIHESTAAPFIWTKSLGRWIHASKCTVAWGCRCCIWINCCSASANSCVSVDILAKDFSGVGSCSCLGGIISIPVQDSKVCSLEGWVAWCSGSLEIYLTPQKNGLACYLSL